MVTVSLISNIMLGFSVRYLLAICFQAWFDLSFQISVVAQGQALPSWNHNKPTVNLVEYQGFEYLTSPFLAFSALVNFWPSVLGLGTQLETFWYLWYQEFENRTKITDVRVR